MTYKKVEFLLNDLLIVYNGLRHIGVYFSTFEEWVESIRFFHKTRTGGVVLNESRNPDEKNKGIWYINIYCPESMPTMTEFKYIMDSVNLMGCKYIAAYTFNQKVSILLKHFNFDMVGDGLYSIRCVK